MKRMDWFQVSRDLFKGGRTGFGWFQGGKDWLRLVSGWEGLVSAGFMREGLVSARSAF